MPLYEIIKSFVKSFIKAVPRDPSTNTKVNVVNIPNNGLEWYVTWQDVYGHLQMKQFKRKAQAVKFSKTL